MSKQVYRILWTVNASNQLEELLAYLFKESPSGAAHLKKVVFSLIRELPSFPFMYPADQLAYDNDGSIRAFVVYRYRITYEVMNDHILILRIRHTSREPEVFEGIS